MNTLRIKDLKFEVESCVLSGFVCEQRLSWSISVETVPMTVDGEHWKPRAYSQCLYPIDGLVVEHWEECFKSSIDWADCYQEPNERVHGGLYVFGHHDISSSHLTVRPVQEDRIEVAWEAKCDVFWGAEYWTDLELEIGCDGQFVGIAVGALGESMPAASAESRLRDCIKGGCYGFVPASDVHEYPRMVPC